MDTIVINLYLTKKNKSHLPLWKSVKQGLLANVCKIPSILVVRHVSGRTINLMIQTLKDLMAVELWVHKMPPSQYLNRIHDYKSHHVYFATNWSLLIVGWNKVEQQKVSSSHSDQIIHYYHNFAFLFKGIENNNSV